MKILASIISAFTLLLFLQSCDSLLDKPQPSDELSNSVVLNNAQTVSGIRLNMYAQLHTFNFTTAYMLGPGALADVFAERKGSGRFIGFIQNARGAGLADGYQFSDRSTYYQVYKLANNANTILNSIPEGLLGEEELNRYQGEAYFFRAFGYFYLSNVLGYMPGMTPRAGQGKGFNLSIVIRLKPTLGLPQAQKLKKRSTAAEVYARVESDLKKSINLLSSNDAAKSASVNWIKAPAAEALLSRVYLYASDWENANKYAEMAIANTSARIATKAEVATMFNTAAGPNPGAIFTLVVNPNNDETNGVESPSGWTTTYWNSLLPSTHIISLYSKNDVRLKAWFGPCSSANVGDCTSQSIEGLELEKYPGNKGNDTDDITYFRVAELLLIETEARIHDPSLGDPLPPINKLRVNRGLKPLTSVTIQDVLDARQRELIGEGMRFFDLKRLGMDIPKSMGQATIPFTDYRLLDNIPNRELQINTDLIQNPNY